MQVTKSLNFMLLLCGLLLGLTISSAAQPETTKPIQPPAQTFERIKVLMLKDGKTSEVAARLRFTGTEVVIEDLSGKALLTSTNDEVKAAGYYFTKHRRWQVGAFAGGSLSIGVGLAIAEVYSPVVVAFMSAGLIALPVAWVLHHTYSKRHWMTLRTGKETVMLRLDKRDYRSVISTLENHTKLAVAWQGER